jgi:hypothetical protein
MSVNAKPYQEGKGWAIRARYKGHDIYKSGQKTAAAAVKEAGKEIAHIDKMGQPAWGGPKDRTVAQALQRYAVQTLPFKKGGDQEARRINRYLRHAGVDEIVPTKPDKPEQLPATGGGRRACGQEAETRNRTASATAADCAGVSTRASSCSTIACLLRFAFVAPLKCREGIDFGLGGG